MYCFSKEFIFYSAQKKPQWNFSQYTNISYIYIYLYLADCTDMVIQIILYPQISVTSAIKFRIKLVVKYPYYRSVGKTVTASKNKQLRQCASIYLLTVSTAKCMQTFNHCNTAINSSIVPGMPMATPLTTVSPDCSISSKSLTHACRGDSIGFQSKQDQSS